jgi:hypothetical protein
VKGASVAPSRMTAHTFSGRALPFQLANEFLVEGVSFLSGVCAQAFIKKLKTKINVILILMKQSVWKKVRS